MIDGCLLNRRQAAFVALTLWSPRVRSISPSKMSIGRWIDDECIIELANELMKTPTAQLWKSWSRYAAANGKSPWSNE